MEQKSIKTPNPKCRLFLKLTIKGTWRHVFICQRLPIPPCYTMYEYMYPYTYSHREEGGGVDEPVRRLEGR